VKVYVEDMQFGFMPGKASTEAMFFCQLREKFRAKDKKVYFGFLTCQNMYVIISIML